MRGVRRVISFLVACLVLSSNAHGAKIEENEKQVKSSAFWLAAGSGLFILVTGGICFLVPGESSETNLNKQIVPKHIGDLTNIADRIDPMSSKNIENVLALMRSLGFNDREITWICFLSGLDILDTSFPFKSCEAFRQTGIDELKKFKAKEIGYDKLQLENLHNYVQLIFPNLECGVSNKDLYLNRNLNGWKNWLKNKNLRSEIQKQLKLNLLLMLEFWNFNVDLDEKSEIKQISANKESIIFKRGGDHNHLRFTRVLNCLRLFGLHKEHELLLNSIENNNEIMSIINSENSLSKSKKFWLETKNVEPLFNDKPTI